MVPNEEAEQGIDLRSLVATLWEGRWLIISATALCSFVALTYALMATQIYRAEALVQPRQESGVGGGLGLLAAQYSGLADLAGISLASGGGDAEVAIATLKSRALVEPFIQEAGVLQKLYAGQWDAEARRWTEDDPDDIPSVWEGYNDFTKDILTVLENKKTGLVTIAIEWGDPVEAQQWVTELIARTNRSLKDKAIQEGERNLAYLESQTRAIGQVELKQAVYGLVEAELKKVMLAKGGDEFAFKTIDPAVVPKKKIWPKRALICVFGFLLGVTSGIVMVLTRKVWVQA
jgi:uncharacterized protein involved in exopolysaccharide biosynthesis